MSPSLLFVGKGEDPHCAKAVAFVRRNVSRPRIHLFRRGDPWPEEIDAWAGDYLVSYLSPLIIPGAVLDRAGRAAINFHPGPPEYPGTGCTNLALYAGETAYGVTCHHMAPRVDSGPIVAVRRFSVAPDESVWTLTQRCYRSILGLFFEIMDPILAGQPLPRSRETWRRRPSTRRELDELCRITPDMGSDEVARRIRAVTYPGAPGAFVELHGHRFVHAAGGDVPHEDGAPT